VLKRLAFRLYRLGVRLGVHVLPAHYYVPLPDVVELSRRREEWAVASSLPGVDADPDRQVATLRDVCLPFRDEYASGAVHEDAVARGVGPGFGPIEAQALHAVIRSLRPARVIEVGSGVSSVCAQAALDRNGVDGAPGELMCIEPHPSQALLAVEGVTVIERRVQQVDAGLFERLEERDLLFVDSSHTVRAGGDVNRLVLEVLPRLRPGVVVHFHDVFLPYDYPPDLLHTIWHWNETSLVHAFLIGNAGVEILFCLSQLHHERPEALREVFPGYDAEPLPHGLREGRARGHFPASLYLRIRG
jgi:predicted O-methyltransferase YrrM